ncbi:MAG: hypothetical protein IPJ07_20505 [Acidobacteria bacterium]|nr:hypothetical protein [Acidobacteriota bacterium]
MKRIEWLTRNVSGNNGEGIGIFGISYPGWTAAMATLNPHPALKADHLRAGFPAYGHVSRRRFSSQRRIQAEAMARVRHQSWKQIRKLQIQFRQVRHLRGGISGLCPVGRQRGISQGTIPTGTILSNTRIMTTSGKQAMARHI